MPNDNRRNPDKQEPREQKEPSPESYPGNPNKQKQETPRQQQAEGDAKHHPSHSRLEQDRSVTDRTVRRTVLGTNDVDPEDDEVDRLKG
jgi:hypothetical protein